MISLHESLALVPLGTCKRVASLDAKSQSVSVNDYINSNSLSYYVAINTWLLLIKEYAPFAVYTVIERITRDGLIPTIAYFEQEARAVIEGQPLSDMAHAIEVEVTAHLQNNNLLSAEFNVGKDVTATLLCLFRYLKRFSPCSNDLIQKQSLKAFAQNENYLKQIQRSSEWSSPFAPYGIPRFYYPWIKEIRDRIASYYPWDELCDKIEALQPGDVVLSSGSAFDAKAAPLSKMKALSQTPWGVEACGTIMGQHVLPRPADMPWPEVRKVKVQAVPKSYKASRIIAMEDTYRLAFGKRVEYIFREYDRMSGKFALDDQSVNQKYAELGSKNHEFATIDASNASDLISKRLFREVFPSRYANLIMPYLGNVLVYPDKTEATMQMASTSGHTLTFRHETIVYKAVVEAASALRRRWCGEDPSGCFGWAYGDDAVCRSEDYDMVRAFYWCVGLRMNDDKSYTGDHPYRESCGKEYLNGYEITSPYFPRFPVVGNVNPISFGTSLYNDEFRGKTDSSLTLLIELQKRIFPFSYPAAQFLASVVRAGAPRITASAPGSVCPDLWDYSARNLPSTPKVAAWVEKSIKRVITTYDSSVVVAGQGWPVVSTEATLLTKRILQTATLEDVGLCEETCAAVERAAALDARHWVPYLAFDSSNVKGTLYEERLYDLWRYNSFLRTGPRYATALDELLGVSEKPLSFAAFAGVKRLAWHYAELR